jgi:hypothetical protein
VIPALAREAAVARFRGDAVVQAASERVGEDGMGQVVVLRRLIGVGQNEAWFVKRAACGVLDRIARACRGSASCAPLSPATGCQRGVLT